MEVLVVSCVLEELLDKESDERLNAFVLGLSSTLNQGKCIRKKFQILMDLELLTQNAPYWAVEMEGFEPLTS